MIRQHVIKKWHELTRRHNGLNEMIIEAYGGPDVREEDDPMGLVRRRREVALELRGLEVGMTDEELEEVMY